jgi:hypothetical protein
MHRRARRSAQPLGRMKPHRTPIVLIFLAAAISATSPAAVADCSDAESSAADACTYARRAYSEDDLDSAQSLMRRARDAAEQAMSNAEDCGCDDAHSAAEEAYTYARRGYNASDLDELHDYARRAMNAAEEAESAASDCS